MESVQTAFRNDARLGSHTSEHGCRRTQNSWTQSHSTNEVREGVRTVCNAWQPEASWPDHKGELRNKERMEASQHRPPPQLDRERKREDADGWSACEKMTEPKHKRRTTEDNSLGSRTGKGFRMHEAHDLGGRGTLAISLVATGVRTVGPMLLRKSCDNLQNWECAGSEPQCIRGWVMDDDILGTDAKLLL